MTNEYSTTAPRELDGYRYPMRCRRPAMRLIGRWRDLERWIKLDRIDGIEDLQHGDWVTESRSIAAKLDAMLAGTA